MVQNVSDFMAIPYSLLIITFLFLGQLRLSQSNVIHSDPGVFGNKITRTLLVLYFTRGILMLFLLSRDNYGFFTGLVAILVVEMIINLFYVYLIVNYELTNFNLRTVVQINGQVDLIGIDIEERVLFRFVVK